MFKKFVSSVRESRRTKEIETLLRTRRLSKVPFLQGADDSLFGDLAAELELLNVEQGGTIFKEGDRGDSVFILVDGSVRLSSNDQQVEELAPGACFGEGALFGDEVRGASAIALGAVNLLELNRAAFAVLAEKHRKVRIHLKKLHERRKAQDIELSIEQNLLNNAPFLSGAGGDLINELAQYLERKNFAEGDVLMQEGDEGSSMFFIEAGIVEISKGGSHIVELGPGACVGEGSLFSRKPRSATVTAKIETSCFELGRTAFDRIISRYPVFAKRLRAIHAERT